MTDAEALREFIRSGTQLVAPSACPELTLYQATSITPLWQAGETFLHQSGLPPPYWAFAWAGGQALARLVLDRPELVRGHSVLDFASGSGVSAIAAAKAGARLVEAREIDPTAAQAILLNAEANGVTITARCADPVDEPAGAWDVILAGDVCYEKPMTDRCFPWLQSLAAKGATVLLADPGRAYLPKAGLEWIARYTIPTSREIEDRDSREAVIYRVMG